jgi:hypothetical protein
VVLELAGQRQQLTARVQAGGHVLQEPVAALQQRQVVGLGVQLGVGDLDAVTRMQLGERGVHLGQVAGLLVQRQRFEFAGGGLELVGVGVVHPYGGWAVRVGSVLVDDGCGPTHCWPPCCGKGRSGGDGARGLNTAAPPARPDPLVLLVGPETGLVGGVPAGTDHPLPRSPDATADMGSTCTVAIARSLEAVIAVPRRPTGD